MTDLQQQIRALSDAEALALLRRFVRALGAGSPAPDAVRHQAQTVADAVSLTSDHGDPLSPGDLARSSLLLVAGDPRYQSALQTLLSSNLSRFSPSEGQIAAADLISVLQTQFTNISDPTAGRIDLPETNAAEQAGLVRVLAQHLLLYAGIQPSDATTDAEYRVWYATSRKPIDPADPAKGFGVERDERIHHGSCKVFIPKSHKVGSTGSSWWKRFVSGADDRMRLLATEALATDVFWSQMQQHLAECAVEDQDAVVFIHGFNVSFQEATLRAAQIGFDLQIKGAMAFYSWASRGEVKMYPADEASVELDEAPIAQFLCDLAVRTGARKVHVIAHSMGNRAVLRAMNQIAQRAEQLSGKRFGQIILAAADIDTRKFKELCGAYTYLSERTTLYVSSRDLAVEASRWLHDFPRAGVLPPVTTMPGIDTVNAVNADVSLLGHGYVAEAREVISDIHAMIRHGMAPERRFGLRPAQTEDGAPYWLIGG